MELGLREEVCQRVVTLATSDRVPVCEAGLKSLESFVNNVEGDVTPMYTPLCKVRGRLFHMHRCPYPHPFQHISTPTHTHTHTHTQCKLCTVVQVLTSSVTHTMYMYTHTHMQYMWHAQTELEPQFK